MAQWLGSAPACSGSGAACVPARGLYFFSELSACVAKQVRISVRRVRISAASRYSAQGGQLVGAPRPRLASRGAQHKCLCAGDRHVVIIGLDLIVRIEAGQHTLGNPVEQPLDVGILGCCKAMKLQGTVVGCGEDALRQQGMNVRCELEQAAPQLNGCD